MEFEKLMPEGLCPADLRNMSERDLLIITVVKTNAMEAHLSEMNGTLKSHNNRIIAIETKCHETTKTLFGTVERIQKKQDRGYPATQEHSRPQKKHVAVGVSTITILGSLGYAAGRMLGWW